MKTYEVELPSGARVEMKALTMRWVDDMTLSRMNEIQAQTKLLDNATNSIVDPGVYNLVDGKLNWDEALVCDRLVAMIAARILIYGPDLPMDVKCPVKLPRCNGKLRPPNAKKGFLNDQQGFTVDLEALITDDVYDLPDESREKLRAGSNQFEIDFHGHKVVFALPTGRSVRLGFDFIQEGDDRMASRSVVSRLVSIDGETDRRKLLSLVQDDTAYWADLRGELDEFDGGVDTEVALECPKCSWEGPVTLPLSALELLNLGRNKPTKRKRRGQKRGS